MSKIENNSSDHVEEAHIAKPRSEKRLVLKQDLIILPLLSGAFFFAYLDRGAIGNARLMGFPEALDLNDTKYFNCLIMFFVGYLVFEFPALVMIRKFHAPTVYALGVMIFGATGIGMGFATTYAQVMILRLLLGFGEAVVQTSFVLLTLWYLREELSTRAAYVYATTPVAGAVSGIVAHSVDIHLDGSHGLQSWQWLFIIGGIPTMCWGALMWLLLPRLPDNEAQGKSLFFRSEEERNLILQRSTAAQNVLGSTVQMWQVVVAAKDPKTWMMAYITGSIGMAIAAFSAFLPTFINSFGFSPITSQLFTIIPYGIAFIFLLVVPRVVDKLQKRALPLMVLVAVAIAGFILLMATTNKIALMVGATLILAAVYPAIVICAAWIPSNNAGYTKRSTAAAMFQISLQVFSIISTEIYTTPPRFLKGHGIMLGLLSVCFGMIFIVTWMMKRSNQEKDKEAARWSEMGQPNPLESKTLEELCDTHPNYRYIY